MSDPFVPRVGGVVSADIAVPEHERELRFYSRVLGTGENPLWREDLLNNRGMPVIGLGARSPEHADLPLQWMPHIQVADVAASVERALDLGGRELMHGKDDHGESQWAVLQDPNGAAFGIIPVVSAEAFPSTDGVASRDAAARVGCISWLDLTVADASATRDFYRQVVDWSPSRTRWRGSGHEGDTGGGWGVRICGCTGSAGGVPGVGAGMKKVQRPNRYRETVRVSPGPEENR